MSEDLIATPNIFSYDTFASGSRPIFLAAGNASQFGKLCELIGAPDLSSDHPSSPTRSANAHRELKPLLEAKLMQFECEPLADRLVRAGVPGAPIHDVPAALADLLTQHRTPWPPQPTGRPRT